MLTELKDLSFIDSANISGTLDNQGYSASTFTNVDNFIQDAGVYSYFNVSKEDVSKTIGDILVNTYDEVYFVSGSYYSIENQQGQMAIIATYDSKDDAAQSLANIQEEYEAISTTVLKAEYQQTKDGSGKYIIVFAIEVIMAEEEEEGKEPTTTHPKDFDTESLYEDSKAYLDSLGYTQVDSQQGLASANPVYYVVPNEQFSDPESAEMMPNCSTLIMIGYLDTSLMTVYGKCSDASSAATTLANLTSGAPNILRSESDEEGNFFAVVQTSSGGGPVEPDRMSVVNFNLGILHADPDSYLQSYGYKPSSAMEATGDYQYFRFSEEHLINFEISDYCSDLILIKEGDKSAVYGYCSSEESCERVISTLGLIDGVSTVIRKEFYKDDKCAFILVVERKSSSGDVENGSRPLADLSISEMEAKGQTIAEYLKEAGYSEFEGTLSEYMSGNPASYTFKVGTGSDMPTSQMPEQLTNSIVFCPICQIMNSKEQCSGFYVECASEEDAQWFSTEGAKELLGNNVIKNEIIGTKVFLVAYAKYKVEVTEFNSTDIAKMGVRDYLNSNDYSEFFGTMGEFMNNPHSYEYKMVDTEELEDAGLIEFLPGIATVAFATSSYSGRSGLMAILGICNFQEDAEQCVESLTNFFRSEGYNISMTNSSNGAFVVIYYVDPNGEEKPDAPTVTYRSISLRHLGFTKAGEYDVAIAPKNQYGEGPRAHTPVKINSYALMKDNELVSINSQNGVEPGIVLSCGGDYHLTVTEDTGKMLPENISVTNVGNYHYIRQSDNYRYGWLNLYNISGDVNIYFGDLPDYSSSTKGYFTLYNANEPEFMEEFAYEVDNWERFAAYENNNFIFDPKVKELQYQYGDKTYYVGTYNGSYYNKVRDFIISKYTEYYIVMDESLFNKPETTLRAMIYKDGLMVNNINFTEGTTWDRLDHTQFSQNANGYVQYEHEDGKYYLVMREGSKIPYPNAILQGIYELGDFSIELFTPEKVLIKTFAVTNGRTWTSMVQDTNNAFMYNVSETGICYPYNGKNCDVYALDGRDRIEVLKTDEVKSSYTYYIDYVADKIYNIQIAVGEEIWKIETTKTKWKDIASESNEFYYDDNGLIYGNQDGNPKLILNGVQVVIDDTLDEQSVYSFEY